MSFGIQSQHYLIVPISSCQGARLGAQDAQDAQQQPLATLAGALGCVGG